jgi:hypothetical protein
VARWHGQIYISADPRISQDFFGEGGGVEIFLHTNLLSENIFPTKGICTRFPRPKEVGGYMKGADWSRFEKSNSVLQASNRVVALL